MGRYSDWVKNREKEEATQSSSFTNNNYARYRAEKSLKLSRESQLFLSSSTQAIYI